MVHCVDCFESRMELARANRQIDYVSDIGDKN